MGTTRYVSTRIAREADAVYSFITDPAQLPRWERGLHKTGWTHTDTAIGTSDDGPIEVCFITVNDLRQCDLNVRMPNGEVLTTPMRVIPDGGDTEVVFTIDGTDMEQSYLDDVQSAVAADLERLRETLEHGLRGGPPKR